MEAEAIVGEDGLLRLPQKQRRSWGFRPGSQVNIEETPDGLLLRQYVPCLPRLSVGQSDHTVPLSLAAELETGLRAQQAM